MVEVVLLIKGHQKVATEAVWKKLQNTRIYAFETGEFNMEFNETRVRVEVGELKPIQDWFLEACSAPFTQGDLLFYNVVGQS